MVLNYPTPIFRVFLDTQVFIEAGFNYKNIIFEKLINLVDDGELILYLTTVTRQEVLSNIEKEVNQSDSSFKRLHRDFRKQGRVFYNHQSTKNLLSVRYNKDKIHQDLQNQFLDYLIAAKAQIISIDKVSP